MKKFLEVIEKKRLMVIFYLLLGVTISLLETFSVSYFRTVLDDFGNKNLTIQTIMIYGASLIIVCILSYFDEYPSNKLAESIYYDFKIEAMKKMRSIDYQSYQSFGTGHLIQQVETGSRAGKNILFNFYFQLVRSLIPNIVFSLFFIVAINRDIVIYIVIGYAFVFIISNILLKYLYKIKAKILNNEEIFNKYLVRSFMEFVVFRVHKQFDNEINKASEAGNEIIESKTKMKLIHEAFFAIFELFVILIKVIILLVSWQSHALSIGAVVALLALIDKAYSPIAIFNVLYVQYKLDLSAFARYTNFLEQPDDHSLDSGVQQLIEEGHIALKDVAFSYENRSIFEGLNLNIPANTKVALIGESGSGKSTLIKLLMGLIKPNQGSLKIDGHNLADLELNYYYNSVSYTSQESPIFHGTLRENIVFDLDVLDEEIEEVIQDVGLSAFYGGLTLGLDTELGEKGIKLSGGERQRVALARLHFKKSKIVILDEATSAMDNLTEDFVMNNLMKNLVGKTVIIIAHRLKSIQYVDTICVMKSGEIIGEGSFENLLEKNQYFKQLWYKTGEIS